MPDRKPRGDFKNWTGFLEMPNENGEALTAAQVTHYRRWLAARDERSPGQTLLGDPPSWRSALAAKHEGKR